ncbi:hypothetical protein BDV12DRAFT_40206 [Aspergillus spectabilis]
MDIHPLIPGQAHIQSTMRLKIYSLLCSAHSHIQHSISLSYPTHLAATRANSAENLTNGEFLPIPMLQSSSRGFEQFNKEQKHQPWKFSYTPNRPISIWPALALIAPGTPSSISHRHVSATIDAIKALRPQGRRLVLTVPCTSGDESTRPDPSPTTRDSVVYPTLLGDTSGRKYENQHRIQDSGSKCKFSNRIFDVETFRLFVCDSLIG